MHERAFEIFLTAPPGLELALKQEVLACGFPKPKAMVGGVRFRGKWPDVWRANLEIRGAARVLARVARFQAMHLDQLEAQTHELDWNKVLRPGVAVEVEATSHKSKIYHQGAAAERVARAVQDVTGAPAAGEPPLRLHLRIEDNQCTLSVDTSGELLHKRGHKGAVGKAPMRENLAALFLRQCGYDGTEPVVDPMCGSGTFVIEAAEIAAGLKPGRSRRFAFEDLASFDADAWSKLRSAGGPAETSFRFYGSDRDAGAVASARANAERAGVSHLTDFAQHAVSDLEPPDGAPGLVIVNPPYGARIGEKKQLYGLYGALGKTLLDRFSGWRVGIVTSETGLVKATGLPFRPVGTPVSHGGMKVRLFKTEELR
ncbi:Ribosomal RNA large subunit methyltransferase L [Roseovarius litorisediminis]|uniref:Ribosomal RNA large subunit methyltransferase L n=1 Tax=Roseovarius litorisediminis TaxID=1312363 RepID=A0A1Y5R5U2_9RHOB|nr:RNA methyltransferase [Roseovarius litorisediminis]SLN09823.1 Ribosomal RNA large subunit methyltransferase L [Roseovarius litorisediminis]